MALGNCNHLWIKAHPSPERLSEEIKAKAPAATRGRVEAYRVGQWTLLTAEREPLILELADSNLAKEWVYLELEPDHDQWEMALSSGDTTGTVSFSDHEQTGRVRTFINDLAPLGLSDLSHYVEWHYDLDAAVSQDGPVALENWPKVKVEHIALPLPPATRPVRPTTTTEIPPQWPLLAGIAGVIVATIFVTLVTHGSADSWSAIFRFFSIAGAVFWTMLMPVLPPSRPENRWLRWLLGVGLITGTGLLVGLAMGGQG